MSCYHHYEHMVFINAPVDADLLRPLVHPDLTLDLFGNTAWVSVLVSQLPETVIDGISVPLIKPYEMQLRTYVTSTQTDGTTLSGVWLFDLFLSDGATSTGAATLFEGAIRCETGNVHVGLENGTYSSTATKLPVTSGTTAGFGLQLDVTDTIVTDTAFFTDRFNWFGAYPLSGALIHSPLCNSSYVNQPLGVRRVQLSTDLLAALGVGSLLSNSVCDTAPYACFFAGASDATFYSPVSTAQDSFV